MGINVSVGGSPVQIPIDPKRGSTLFNIGSEPVYISERETGNGLESTTMMTLQPGTSFYWNSGAAYGVCDAGQRTTVYTQAGNSPVIGTVNLASGATVNVLGNVTADVSGSVDVKSVAGTVDVSGSTVDVTGSVDATVNGTVDINTGSVTITGSPPVTSIAPPYAVLTTVDVGGQSAPYEPGPFTLTQDIVALAFRWRYTAQPSSPSLLQLSAMVFSPSSAGGSIAQMGGVGSPLVAPPAVGDEVVCVANNGDPITIGYDIVGPSAPSAFPANLVVDVLAMTTPQAVVAEPVLGMGPTTGQTTIATAGTALPLTSTWYGVNYGTRVRALVGNKGKVYLGRDTVTESDGEELAAGDVAVQPSPPHVLWIIGPNAGDGVSWYAT